MDGMAPSAQNTRIKVMARAQRDEKLPVRAMVIGVADTDQDNISTDTRSRISMIGGIKRRMIR